MRICNLLPHNPSVSFKIFRGKPLDEKDLIPVPYTHRDMREWFSEKYKAVAEFYENIAWVKEERKMKNTLRFDHDAPCAFGQFAFQFEKIQFHKYSPPLGIFYWIGSKGKQP